MQFPKRVTLTFKRDELLYDCANLGYVEGDVLRPDASAHVRHQVQDIVQAGNVDWVTRVLGLGIARCRELLYPYSKTDVADGTVMDDELESPESYVINLNVPSTFSQTTITFLEHLIHMLLVYRVMLEWTTIANAGNSWSKTNWAEKIAETEEEITGTLNARTGRVRKFQSMF